MFKPVIDFINEHFDSIFVIVSAILIYTGIRFLIYSSNDAHEKQSKEIEEAFNTLKFGTEEDPEQNLNTEQKARCNRIRAMMAIEGNATEKSCIELLETDDMKQGFTNNNDTDDDLKQDFDNMDKHLATHIVSPKFKSYQNSYSLSYGNVLDYASMRQNQKTEPIQGCISNTYTYQPIIEGFASQTIDCKNGSTLDGSATGNSALSSENDKQQEKLLKTFCQSQADAQYDSAVPEPPKA